MKSSKKYTVLLFLVWIISGIACHNELDINSEDHQQGVLPLSIEQVEDVFELKYGEVKECTYDGQLYTFSIMDIEDNRMNCSVIDFGGFNESDEFFNSARIHVSLQIENGVKGTQLKVSTKPCGAFRFFNDGTDIQNVWDLLESMQSCFEITKDFLCFQFAFSYKFGEGTLLDQTSFSIFIANIFPDFISINPANQIDKSNYKFIFLLTNQKTKNHENN